MTNSLKRLVRRFVAAKRHGFFFCGTTYSSLPRTVRLAGRIVKVSYPSDGREYLYDLMNVWLDDEYGIESIAPFPETIADIGANIGLFSLKAWSLWPHARIVAFEPNPVTLQYTRKNLDSTNVELLPFGVSDVAGKATIHQHEKSTMASTEMSESGDIQIVSLEDVVNKLGGQIDLLKIDCEGAEWDIFRSPSMQSVRNVRMEYHLVNNKTLTEMMDLVRVCGFDVDHHEPNQGFGILWLSRVART